MPRVRHLKIIPALGMLTRQKIINIPKLTPWKIHLEWLMEQVQPIPNKHLHKWPPKHDKTKRRIESNPRDSKLRITCPKERTVIHP